MAYFIKSFENTYNHYKYHYLDHITAVIDMRDNYWDIVFDLHSINNFSLPVNSLAADIQLPYQQINGISFNFASDQSGAKTDVIYNRDYAKLYSGHFTVDISQNELFKLDLNNMKIDLSLSLYIDPEAAKGAGTDVQQEDLDKLMVETEEQRWDFHLYYTNTHLIKQNQIVDNAVGYSLPFGNECIPTVRQINVNCDNLSNITNAFNNLTHLSSDVAFQVISAKIKFYYWIELSSESQMLEKTLEIKSDLTKNVEINLDDFTLFDYENNKVVFDPAGVPGFYIPQASQGYYELELQIKQETVINKFIIKNSFNFVNDQPKPTIQIAHRVIEEIDLKIWKVVKNYD